MSLLETRKIAARYARALFDAAQEQGIADTVAQDMHALQRLYLELPELHRFFENRLIPVSEKTTLLTAHVTPHVSPTVGNLLTLLVENDRLGLLSDIVTVYRSMLETQEGVGKAEVTVPVPLSDALEKTLQTTLANTFGYSRVELSIKVDPAILAGAVVRIGDRMIDGSYHGKLEMLRRQVG